MPSTSSSEIRQSLAPTGKLRVGVYPGSPFSLLHDAASGEARGVTVEVGKALAASLDVPYEQVEFPRMAEILVALKAERIDIALSNKTPARANDHDWSPPLLVVECGYLVAAGSPLQSIDDIDRPGVRVGVTEGGTSHHVLPQKLQAATLLAAKSIDGAIGMLTGNEIDAYATNKAILFEMSDRIAGTRVLDGHWGLEHIALAIPPGREAGMAYLREFLSGAKSSSLVMRAAARAGLRGIVTA